ncbi:MAG TPA: hypothetical protein VMU87_20395 [Stellaceae bacterium]|nr:hypothetical protein [Stellaceae bacterium]
MADNIHLVVATPCFGGQVSSIYAASLFKLQGVLRASYGDIRLKLEMQENDALITRARANLVAAFLDDPTATHLLFIDADIGFEPEQVLRLLACGADVCAAVYPIKRIDWEKIRRTVAAGRLEAGAALHYVLEVEDPNRIVTRGQFTRVRYAGTGFLMIRRHVLETMCERHQALRFRADHNYRDALAHSPNRVALFECMIDPETGVYLSEDFSFCRRWTDMGGEIWADLASRLKHVGPTTYEGNLATQFMPIAAPDAGEAVA